MADTPRYLGATEFIEELCTELLSAPFKPQYRDEEDLKEDVIEIIKSFIKSRLDPLNVSYNVWKKGNGKIEPIPIFGTDFYPELVIEVEEFPIVALNLEFIQEDENPLPKISSAIGQALVYSRQYPGVIAFIWNKGRKQEHKHWWDWECKTELWKKHKIKLVIRE
jgi:hypothetical protein